METDRSTTITIGGKEYELILTTKATKEIAKRYGGISDLGDKLLKSENMEQALEEIVYLITLLANQSILIYNYENPTDRQELLTEERIEILTSPYELANFKDAIMSAMQKGTKRDVESEDENSKNVSPK